MRPRSVPALLTLMLLPMFGCAGSATERLGATEPPGVSHGTSVVRVSPSSSHSSPSPLPSWFGAPPLEALGWEGVVVRTVCLDVESSFDYAEVENAIREGIENTLAQLEIEVAPAGGSCEATISVTLAGEALSANYGSAGVCFTGLKLDGMVTFQGGGRPPIQSAIERHHSPPFAVTSCPKAPEVVLCGWAAGQVFNRVVNLWDSSMMAPNPSPTKVSIFATPTSRPLVGGRTHSFAYQVWCTGLATAFPSPS